MAELNEPLTERELEVVRLVATGLTNKEVAGKLFLSPSTVKVHLNNIFTKLDLHTRTELSMHAVRNGWLVPIPVPGVSQQTSAIRPVQGLTEPLQIDSDVQLPVGLLQQEREMVVQPALRVAPNPQPLPPLSSFRKGSMIVVALLTLLASLSQLAAPHNPGDTATPDGTSINENIGNEALLPGEASRWFQRADLPVPRARSSAASVAGKIYLIAGETNQTATADVQEYDRTSNTWTTLDQLKPTAVWNAAASTISGRIFVTGGNLSNGVATDKLEVFTPADRTWQMLAPMPKALSGHAMTAAGNKLYVFGGRTATGLSADTYIYDLATNSWRRGPPLPTPRSLAGSAALDNKLYLVGGFDDGREVNTCEYLDLGIGEWKSCAPLLVPRGSIALIATGNTLFAIGGGRSGFVASNERYNPNTNRWVTFETPFVGDWHSMASATLGSEAYAIGGYSNGRRLSFAYVYEAQQAQTFLPAVSSQP